MADIFKILSISFLCLFTPSCASPEAPVAPAANPEKLSCRLGETIEVLLESNPTTGYQWFVVDAGNPNLKLLGSEYRPSSASENLCGAGGNTAFYFKAVAAGTSSLKFKYARPWENAPLKCSAYEVSIR